jgi:hypothetical protein
MSHVDNVIDIRRPVEFTIDGRAYRSGSRRRSAADLLRLAGLDPARYDLGELRTHRPRPVRFADTDIVVIHKGTRFVSLPDRCMSLPDQSASRPDEPDPRPAR